MQAFRHTHHINSISKIHHWLTGPMLNKKEMKLDCCTFFLVFVVSSESTDDGSEKRNILALLNPAHDWHISVHADCRLRSTGCERQWEGAHRFYLYFSFPSKRTSEENSERRMIRQQGGGHPPGRSETPRRRRSCLSGLCQGHRPWSGGPGRIQTWLLRRESAICHDHRRTKAGCSPGCAHGIRPEFSARC